VGLPAVIVPYPYSGQHQLVNAQYLSARGAGVLLPDDELDVRFYDVVRGLLSDPERLAVMRAAAQRLAVPDAAQRIARELARLAGRV
jgi:UDP-N-acetylglucosamine--N-acetylmuramyl-(pentapeptide) pyrophosphoryl-undecaprenol N-acetylglucosamine transferase